jgi:hypothetical protein
MERLVSLHSCLSLLKRHHAVRNLQSLLNKPRDVSRRLVEALAPLVEQKDWNAEGFYHLNDVNRLLGTPTQPALELWQKLIHRNRQALLERYDASSRVDKTLKLLLINHVEICEETLPDPLSEDEYINVFLDEYACAYASCAQSLKMYTNITLLVGLNLSIDTTNSPNEILP